MMSIFNGWEKMKWEDLVTLEYGKGLRDYRNSDGQYPVFGTNGQIGWHHECLCPFAGVIIGRKGAYRGIHYSNSPFFVIDTAFYLKPIINGSFCVKWAYYQLLDFDINKMDSGSAIPSTSRNAFYAIQLHVPPLSIQYKIAAILSAYDDLIENNLRRIKILEEMAQNLYREWFVKFRFPGHEQVRFVDSPLGRIPESWEAVAFTDIADVLSGGTPSTTVEEYWSGSIPFFAPKDAPESFYVTNTEKSITALGLKKCNSKLYQKNTVFITARGTVGKVVMPSIDMAMNQSCYALRGKEGISQLYLFLATKDKVEYLKKNTGGATFDTIVVDTFKRMLVAKPCREVIDQFSCLSQPVMEMILNVLKKNATLRRTRDMLLPKLISGEVEVSELAIALPEEVAA